MSDIEFKPILSTENVDLEGLKSLVDRLRSHLLRPGVLLLKGSVGAGKTQTLKLILNQTGGYESLASPTYAIHHSYQVKVGRASLSIEHFDLYRLQDLEQLETTGFWDLISDPSSLVVVEWPDKVPMEWWPQDRDLLLLEIVKKTDLLRDIKVSQRC